MPRNLPVPHYKHRPRENPNDAAPEQPVTPEADARTKQWLAELGLNDLSFKTEVK